MSKPIGYQNLSTGGSQQSAKKNYCGIKETMVDKAVQREIPTFRGTGNLRVPIKQKWWISKYRIKCILRRFIITEM